MIDFSLTLGVDTLSIRGDVSLESREFLSLINLFIRLHGATDPATQQAVLDHLATQLESSTSNLKAAVDKATPAKVPAP